MTLTCHTCRVKPTRQTPHAQALTHHSSASLAVCTLHSRAACTVGAGALWYRIRAGWTASHGKNKFAARMIPFLVLGVWDQKHRDMRRRHTISLGFSGHYQDLGLSSLEMNDSADCNLILSVAKLRAGAYLNPPQCRVLCVLLGPNVSAAVHQPHSWTHKAQCKR